MTHVSLLPRGLYAITPDWLETRRLISAVEQAIAGGAVVLQYRNKIADSTLRLQQATALADLCQQARIPLIINDDVDLAWQVNAAGVHLGGTDGDLRAARQKLGMTKIIGASCYADLANAQPAIAAGASYVAFGAAFASSTKPHAPTAPIHLYRTAVATLSVPVVAIGGISPDNAVPLIDAGVNNLAVIGGLFEHDDIANTAAHFTALY